MGRHCIRKKRVWSDVLGRNVMRCAEFSDLGGGLAELGAIPIEWSQIQTVLINGGVAAGGALTARRSGYYLLKTFKVDPTKESYEWYRKGIELVIGIGGGYAIGRFIRPDLGVAFAVGPVAINAMETLSQFIAPPEEAPVSGYGYDPALGVTVESDRMPAWARESPYMNQVQQPAWAMG